MGIVPKIIISGFIGIILTLVPALFSDDYPNSMDAAFNVPVMFAVALIIGGWMAHSIPREERSLGPAIAVGASLMVFYPVWGVIDAFIHPAAHTLLGVELLVYAVFAVICGIVALMGYILVVQISRRFFDKGKER